MRYVALVAVPAGALFAFVFYISVLAPGILRHQGQPAPEQPIRFDHRVHVLDNGIQCAMCHRDAAIAPDAGMPSVQQCMDCHQVVGATAHDPEIDKVRLAAAAQRPIDWQRVYALPDHVQFDHAAHIQAGVSCTECHGNVGEMREVTKKRALNMNDCVDCHREHNAPTECAECHY
ncbi:MAG TPA: cytochrome c3 family protein [Chloroflexota bacterium]|nr:cytochrome c3 family protein [Chloroflexota bacterium]